MGWLAPHGSQAELPCYDGINPTIHPLIHASGLVDPVRLNHQLNGLFQAGGIAHDAGVTPVYRGEYPADGGVSVVGRQASWTSVRSSISWCMDV